jgi:uncharacterized protein YfdQ (DUF2303 family)
MLSEGQDRVLAAEAESRDEIEETAAVALVSALSIETKDSTEGRPLHTAFP